MKKMFAFLLGFTAIVFSLQAQPPGGGNMDEMRAKMKERIKPMLITQTSISDVEADKVIEIYFQSQLETRKLRMNQSLSEEDKTKKAKAITEDAEKQLKAVPLTDEKIVLVNAFFEEVRKRQQKMRENRGGNN
jgi:hypothetical protein